MELDAMAFLENFNSYLFAIVIAFIALDVITGYAQAVSNHEVKSDVMRKGFWHKLALVFALVAAGLLDAAAMVETQVETGLGINAPIFEGACIFIIWMELTSVLENLCKMNTELAESKVMKLFGDDEKADEHGDNENEQG